MDCKQINDKLIFYVEKSLNDDEIAMVKSHIDSCDSCKQISKTLEASLKIIEDEKNIKTNPFLHTRVMQEIENRKQSNYGVSFSLRKSIQPVLYSAALIIGISFGIGLGNLTTNNNNTLANNSQDEIFFNDFNQEPIESFLLNE